jgi:hypothetical protein
MFLGVSLIIEDLRYSPIQEIHEKLDSMPSNLDDLYQKLLDQVCQKHNIAQLARRILLWVVNAPRPMTVAEPAWACAVSNGHKSTSSVDPDKRLVQSFLHSINLCGPILKLASYDYKYHRGESHGNKEVRLVNQSA